ncbi:MAG TPA: c-type cytochrome [Candidatus Acidoferrales bacterium]|nr:c-type cytochrome [Candidatus Acidoferrales bacterium]
MKTDDRSLLKFSFAVAGIAVAALVLAGRPAPLIARSSPPRTNVSPRPAQANGAQAAQEPAQKTAGEVYMNLQVLKEIPSDQLIPAMQYITAALGVECQYCHVPRHFDSDDKQTKATARKMMQMMFAIDKDNFNGRREVTCYTCHRGASKAESMPILSASTTGQSMMGGAGMSGRPNGMGMGMAKPSEAGAGANAGAASLPAISVDAIIAKYTDALGGAAAIQKITTLDEKGVAEMASRGMKVDVEEVRKAPDKAMLTVHMPNGAAMSQGYDGANGWHAFPGRPAEDLTWDDLVRAKQWASFIPGLNLKQDFVRAQAAGTEKIGDQEAYRVIGFRKGGGRVMFYFDAQSGLLLRVSERIESPLGSLPQDTDYSDYRDVSGVKLPFTVTVAHVQGPTIYKWDQIQANVSADDSRFEKPAQKTAQP